MKIGVVSDIHGNATALARAFATLDDADHIFCLGDAVDQSRFSNEVVALLRERDALCVNGNHEAMLFANPRASGAPWVDGGHLDWLRGQPASRRIELAGRRIFACHATPWESGFAYVSPVHPDFRRFAEADADLVLYGHTHWRTAVRVGATLVVNPGSAGEHGHPSDGRVMSCALIDLASMEVRHFDV